MDQSAPGYEPSPMKERYRLRPPDGRSSFLDYESQVSNLVTILYLSGFAVTRVFTRANFLGMLRSRYANHGKADNSERARCSIPDLACVWHGQRSARQDQMQRRANRQAEEGRTGNARHQF